jgi:hypothetical protein
LEVTSDFQSFPNAVLENDDLQDEVMSVVMTATANGPGLGDGIATLGMKHNYFFTSEEVYEHADFLGQDDDLTDFELEMISGGWVWKKGFLTHHSPQPLNQILRP